MKRLLSILLFCSPAIAVLSQSPIQWQYTAKKISDKSYEVHISGTLKTGWHAYSQSQPEEAVAQPTQIKFKPNPLLSMQGKIKEFGALEKWQDQATGIKANQYKDKVDFVQVVVVKGNVKTSVSGSLTYQVCTDEMCLPPKTEPFNVELGQ
jgi:cytochrome c biogenesis DsbD-like protein